eukprot:gene5136-1739_t
MVTSAAQRSVRREALNAVRDEINAIAGILDTVTVSLMRG